MTIVPCLREPEFEAKAEKIANLLKTRAHELATAEGISEDDFYDKGYFRAAIEKIRGQYAAKLSEKKAFLREILNSMQQDELIGEWNHAGNRDRHDYQVSLVGGGTAVIEQKGCLDGNNVNISERPPNADEFYIWSICTNQGSDLALGIRSAIHRITADMVTTGKKIDGLIVWDMMCGTSGRACPKLIADPSRATKLGPYNLPPPCIYLFPSTVGHVRNNPRPELRQLASLKFASTLLAAFKGNVHDANQVGYELKSTASSVRRQARIVRDGKDEWVSDWATIRRVTG